MTSLKTGKDRGPAQKFLINLTVLLTATLVWSGNSYARDLTGLAGVDSNFFYSPIGPFHDGVRTSLKGLGAGIIRFPGGWNSNNYDWEKGSITPREDARIPRRVDLDAFMAQAGSDGLKVIYTINVFEPVEKTVRLVKKLEDAGYPVIAYEIGNELYNRHFIGRIGGVEGYWKKAGAIVKALSSAGVGKPVGLVAAPACVPGRKGDRTFAQWNRFLSKRDLSAFDAVTFHYYLGLRGRRGFEDVYRVARDGLSGCVADLAARFPGKEVWLTEWNLGGPGNSEYHNTMSHALLAARIFMAALSHDSVTMAAYHAFSGTAWELIAPDFDIMGYTGNMEKNDDKYSALKPPLIRTVPYFVMKAFFDAVRSAGPDAKVLYSSSTGYGDLPVEVISIGSGFVAVINPNNVSMDIAGLPGLSLPAGLRGFVLKGGWLATNGSFTRWKFTRKRMTESVVPVEFKGERIGPVSFTYFTTE